MYMTVEMLPVIGLLALLATATGWARMTYVAARESHTRADARTRAAAARQAFKAAQGQRAANEPAREARQAS